MMAASDILCPLAFATLAGRPRITVNTHCEHGTTPAFHDMNELFLSPRNFAISLLLLT